MLEIAALLVMVVGLELPFEADVWPVDEVVIEQVEKAAARWYKKVWGLEDAVEYEQSAFLRATVVFIGECVGEGATAPGRYGPCETQLFWTERCFKGTCADTVALHSATGMMRGGMFNMPLGSRPIDWSSPDPGKRYLLLGRADSEDPDFLWGGTGHERYELQDGMVLSKGIPESLFVSAVERLLAAAADSPGSARGD
jgi:hypothetical protein